MSKFRIEIEVMENAYEVCIPDIDAFNKAEADVKKASGKGGACAPSVWAGDYMKSYAAKTVDEALALIKPALKKLPQTTYAEAFAEATKEME
jgi:hypothetical protein